MSTHIVQPQDDLKQAIEQAQSGDVVCLTSGTFNMGNQRIFQPDNVSVSGMGEANTFVVFDGSQAIWQNGSGGCCWNTPTIIDGAGCSISSLSIHVKDKGVLCAPLGAVSSDYRRVGPVILNKMTVYGVSDSLYWQNIETLVSASNCHLYSNWDIIYLTARAEFHIQDSYLGWYSKPAKYNSLGWGQILVNSSLFMQNCHIELLQFGMKPSGWQPHGLIVTTSEEISLLNVRITNPYKFQFMHVFNHLAKITMSTA